MISPRIRSRKTPARVVGIRKLSPFKILEPAPPVEFATVTKRSYTVRLIKIYSHSPEPWKLCGVCIAKNYTPLRVAYYEYKQREGA